MENSKVSIIIPIYKVENYLTECLESCINQSYKNIEIIAVNDGSPDNCGDIIDHYAAKDERVIHLKKENEGVAAARESGINASTGAYIMFVDGDDFLTFNAVELFMETAVKEDADMVFSDFIDYYKQKAPTINTNSLHHGLVMSMNDCVDNHVRMEMWGRIIRRELCLNCELQKLNIGEDKFAMIQILIRCKKNVYLKVPLYYYRHNETSLMHKPDTIKNEIEHKMILTDFVIQKGYPAKVIHFAIMTNVPVISEYCNDYNNPITASQKETIRKLTKLSLKHYPKMLREHLLSDKLRGIIIFYIIHYFPNTVKLIHKYNKLRGKKNYEL